MLPFKTRSMLNIAMLTAMSQHHELGVHVRGALNNGVSVEKIRVVLVLMQTAVYCAATAVFRVVTAAINDWEGKIDVIFILSCMLSELLILTLRRRQVAEYFPETHPKRCGYQRETKNGKHKRQPNCIS